jgi:predicted nuclease of predicted toxin-antitoxin system
MKLLFDQNISHRLIYLIKDIYPEAKQVREIGLENSSDKQIWECNTPLLLDQKVVLLS